MYESLPVLRYEEFLRYLNVLEYDVRIRCRSTIEVYSDVSTVYRYMYRYMYMYSAKNHSTSYMYMYICTVPALPATGT